MFPPFSFSLPEWIYPLLPQPETCLPTVEKRMELVIELVRVNIDHGGGPFAAAIFDLDRHTLIAPGINLVVPGKCSVLHAEMVAFMIGQQVLQSFSFSSICGRRCELVTSCEPCAMCLGATPWSGVSAVVCGARDEDARRIGFDEGTKPREWVSSLRKQGIIVTQDVCRENIISLMNSYADCGGPLYNGLP